MKRLLTFLTLLTVFIGVGWAATQTITVDFESNSIPSGWTNSNFEVLSNQISETSLTNGSYCASTGGKANATLTYDTKLTGVSSISVDAARTTNNTNSNLYIQYSTDNSNWVDAQQVTINKSAWTTTTYTFASATDCYVRICWKGTTAVKLIDNIVITYGESGGQQEPDPTTPEGTITFDPVAGEVTSGTTVAMSFSGTCDGIKYTLDGTSPSATNGTVYDVSNPPAITSATTITAAAYNYSNSTYAFGIEATAAYTVAIPTVDYDGTATFDATVDTGTSPLTKDPVSFACTSGVLNNGTEYRLYKDSETTFSVPTGYKIVKIEFTCTSGNPISGFASTTGLVTDGNNGTWTGEAESVTFVASNKQVRCTLINVYYTAPDLSSEIFRVIKTNGDASNEAGGWFGYWSTNCSMPNGTDGNHYTVTAPAGETVQFKAGTNSGYQIFDANVSAVDANNNTITLTKVADLSDDTGSTFTFTMPATDVTLTANFTSYQSDLYILGTANDKTWSASDGVQMTYDATAEKYSADVYFAGTSGDGAYGFFSFAESLTGDWNTLVRYGATSNNKEISSGSETVQSGSNAFKIPAGIYTIEVNKSKNQVTVTPKQVEFTFTPAAGSSVYQGQSVTVSSNLYTLLSAINSSIAESSVTNEVSLDGTTYSSSVSLSSTGSATVTGKATYGYIAPTETANYTVTEVDMSNVYTLVESEDDLVADGEYIIAGGASGDPYTVLMGAVSGNGAAVTTGFTYDATAKTMTLSDGCEAQVLTLGGSADAWTFYTGSAYLSLTSDGNNLNTSATADATNAKWTIDANAMPLSKTLIANNEYTSRYIEYNSGSPRFACYKNTQQAVALFKKAAASNKSTMPTITPATCNVKGGLLEGVMITAADGATIYYTLDGTDPTTSSPEFNGEAFNVTGTGGESKTVKAIAVETGKEPSNIATAVYTFQAPSNPVITPDGGTYDGTQHVSISSTDGGIIYYLVDPDEAPTNAAGVISANQVYTAGTTAITLEAGTHTVYAAVDLNGITSWAQESYTINADPMTLSFSPAAGTYVNAQNVTITANNAIGDYTIYYTTDGSVADASSTVYDGAISVTQDMTINAYAVDSRDQGMTGKEATATATYKIGVQPVEYSPLPGNYYVGDDGDITVEMFSVTPNAKVYYTMTDDGTEPADPSTASDLYNRGIPLETGKTYRFKAIAAAGQQVTEIAPATYTIGAMPSSGWVHIDAMNNDDNYTTDDVLLNPVQVVYMSTWRNNGTKPEFCFIRDNSGYGMVYFGGSNVSAYNSWAKFQMGDWLPGNKISGTLNVWSDSFINELGGSSGTLESWPSANEKLGNSDILPEETTNLAITQGWTYEGAYSGTDYAQYIDPDKNLFGHYVHMRKNTITNVTGSGNGQGKHAGIITDQSGVPLNYYDGLYLFSGYNNTLDYNQAFFDEIQNNGGTFDIYAIVYFYGTNATKEEYSYAPYEIFPIDFMYIYKPLFNIQSGTYMEPQTVTLTCATEGAQIWYKTSEMEDYALYTGPITVDATTTIEAYSTIPTKYNDVMESVVNSITINIGSIEAPVITEPSVVKTVGESVTTTITCETGGATIYYTIDGSDPKTSETRQVYNSALTFEETTTVRAIAYKEVEGTGYYSAEAEAKTYTFVKSNGIVYDLVTSTSQLNENSVYVIVNKANNMAVGTTQNENNRNGDGVMFVENTNQTKVYGNDELAQFTLKKVGNNWYMQTANSSVNGYLCVGNGNTLLTEATADGNAEATIDIDGNSVAHISFMYNYETVRYLRYWLGGQAFSTYTSENANLPVSLYYVEATPLATIEKEGVVDNQYTIADQLIAVEYRDVDGGAYLWCKDQGNVSIDKTECTSTQVDFMKQQGQQVGEWDQSNWVVLKLTGSTAHNIADGAKGHYINPATVTGYYIDDVNYMIEVTDNQFTVGEAVEYTPNVYSPANFMPGNLNINGGQGGQTSGDSETYYFFMNPKVQEICKVTFSEWYEDGLYFTVPYTSGFDGAFNVAWTYNELGDISDKLTDETAYYFHAVVTRTSKTAYGPKNNTTPNGAFLVYPTDLTVNNDIPTAINTVDAGKGEVKSVKYVNVAGIVSDVPFQGVNIVVTEYTDGSRTTTKMLKK